MIFRAVQTSILKVTHKSFVMKETVCALLKYIRSLEGCTITQRETLLCFPSLCEFARSGFELDHHTTERSLMEGRVEQAASIVSLGLSKTKKQFQMQSAGGRTMSHYLE